MLRFMSFLPREGRIWLFLTGGLFLAGWIKGINLLMLLAYLLLALWLVNLVLASLQLRGVTGRRIARGPFFAGRESFWYAEVTNSRRWGSSGWRLIDAGTEHRQQWFVDRLNHGQSVRFRGQTIFQRRGVYRVAPLTASCLHPFGLVQRQRQLAPAEEWLVLPQIGELALARFQRWLARMARGEGRLFRVTKPSMIHQDDLHGLRPFRPGDNPRWIHWRTTARRGQTMVREFEVSAGQNLLLILDPWSENPAVPDAGLEAAISLAATICWEWCRERHDRFLLGVASSAPELISGYAFRDTAVKSLQALARVSGESRTNPAPLLNLLAHSRVPDALPLVIGQRPNSDMIEALSRQLRRPVIMLQPVAASDFYSAPGPQEGKAKKAVKLMKAGA
ncbi:MAG TPA: DUF58 domain-containing protein [Gemmataceae bacterium]|jgi:uncharacterized protein (DUF58 family)|nr:DUF58 domain-containing protein [Gemmataceae bacterium]